MTPRRALILGTLMVLFGASGLLAVSVSVHSVPLIVFASVNLAFALLFVVLAWKVP